MNKRVKKICDEIGQMNLIGNKIGDIVNIEKNKMIEKIKSEIDKSIPKLHGYNPIIHNILDKIKSEIIGDKKSELVNK